MSELVKTAVVAGAVHKLLSKKKKSEKTDDNICYRYSRRTDNQNQTLYVIVGLISIISALVFIIFSIRWKYYAAIIPSLFLIFLSIICFKNIKRTT